MTLLHNTCKITPCLCLRCGPAGCLRCGPSVHPVQRRRQRALQRGPRHLRFPARSHGRREVTEGSEGIIFTSSLFVSFCLSLSIFVSLCLSPPNVHVLIHNVRLDNNTADYNQIIDIENISYCRLIIAFDIVDLNKPIKACYQWIMLF